MMLTINAVSGYSGGGKAMIAAHEAEGGPAFELYALGLTHKHVPEIMRVCRADAPADFRARRSGISRRACWSASRCFSTGCRASRGA